MMDLHYNVKYTNAEPPAAATTDNTAWETSILDTANYEHNELVIITGELADADATFTVLLEEGDESDMSDASAVADSDLLGTESEAGFDFDDDDSTTKLGYIGTKRYLQATITPSGNSGNAFLAAVWAQGGARKAPVS